MARSQFRAGTGNPQRWLPDGRNRKRRPLRYHESRRQRTLASGFTAPVNPSSKEFRINVRGLALGQYVSRLDRPWVETKFPLQGLLIRKAEEIAQLQRVCRQVYVDVTRGNSPHPSFIEFDEPEVVQRAKGIEQIQALRKTTWQTETGFEAELVDARIAHGKLSLRIEDVMRDLRSGHKLDLQKLTEGIDAMVDSITRNPAAFGWLMEIRRRDEYSYHHALGCAIWAASFGRHLGVERPGLRELALGGLLCDVGKTRLPAEVLASREKLSAEQAELVRMHVRHSLEILTETGGLNPRIIEMVAGHHERHDGSGYPLGLRGNDIPINSRILGLVDSYDAMTSNRPYASAVSPHRAVAELYEFRDSKFQGELVEQFIQTCGIYPTGSLVELSDGRVGVVTGVHALRRLRPRVMLLLDSSKRPLAQFTSIDLAEEDTNGATEPISVKNSLSLGAYGIDPDELFLS